MLLHSESTELGLLMLSLLHEKDLSNVMVTQNAQGSAIHAKND